MHTDSASPLIIWHLTDGKPGHMNQSLGLIQAIQRQTSCEFFDIPVSGLFQPLMNYLSATWPLGNGLPLPDLIIAAGHGTHLHMLAARKVYGGKAVLLMQPSLPVALFDLCLIPEHDAYQGGGDFFETRGVLNTMQGQGQHKQTESLIMIGGPSKHFAWDGEALLKQVDTVTAQNPQLHYTLTTSRRTPSDFIDLLADLNRANLTIVPFNQTEKGWVASKLAASYSAWITADSASMVYEALTAHTAVGILNMPVKRENRVLRGLNKLIDSHFVRRFDQAINTQQTLQPALEFAEADRTARWLLNEWDEAELIVTPTPSTVHS